MDTHDKLLDSLKNFSRLHGSTMGADRLIRIYIFLLRFYRTNILYKLQARNLVTLEGIISAQKNIDIVMQQFGLSRKILRWSRTFYYLFLFAKSLQQKTPECKKRRLKLWMDIVFYNYLILSDINDFCLWLCQIGVCQSDKIKQQTRVLAPKLYFYECIVWGIMHSIDIAFAVPRWMEQRNKTDEQSKKELVVLKKQMTTSGQNILRYLLDIPVAYSYVDPSAFQQETVVLVGLTSSIISIYQAWTA